MKFGDLVKELRVAQKKTLRQFCLEHSYDPSNWSKIERGINPPPNDIKILERWADQLDLKRGSDEWQNFLDRAALAKGEIPPDIMEDATIVEKLPVFFRTARNAELGEVELDDLIRKIKKAHSRDED